MSQKSSGVQHVEIESVQVDTGGTDCGTLGTRGPDSVGLDAAIAMGDFLASSGGSMQVTTVIVSTSSEQVRSSPIVHYGSPPQQIHF